MSATINQKAYLQKYLKGPSGDKKKKKKKSIKGKGFKIIDDDIDLSKLRALDGDELDIYDEGEDAPQIAGIIDDRPEELKKLEQFKTNSKWKVVNQDDGFNSKLQVQEIKTDVKEVEKENELVFGKMYSDSEDEKKNDSDISPPRKQSNHKQKANSDSDVSPPRKGNRSPRRDKRKNNDSDISRKQSKETKQSSNYSKKHNSDSDFSPPRRGSNRSPKRDKTNNTNNSSDTSRLEKPKERVRKPSRWGEEVISQVEHSPKQSKGRHSPPRKSRRDSDASPPRKSRKDDSPPRKPRKKYDSDESPPRKSKSHSQQRKKSPSPSKRRITSPQRQNYKDRNNSRPDKSRKQRHSSDSDLSPPRKNKRQESPTRKSKKQSSENKRKYNSDSDQSPPRRNRREGDSPPPSNKKMTKTLEGKMAGLQDARMLRQENEAFRRKEDDVFNKMSDEVSGRNAQVVSRKSKRETSEERQKQREKADRQKELDEKYKKWSKGIKQLEAQEARVQEYLHESSKPLARHRGDRDLEDNLKNIERDGDPMLQYIKEKKRERGELGPEKPQYKGNFPPNRFNIRPGYRWDGVDRSNGYEKKFFEQQSKRKAQEEEAYKWSIEDL